MLCDVRAEDVAWLPHVSCADGAAAWPQATGEARAPNGEEANAADAVHACCPEKLLPNGDADEPVELLPNGDCPGVAVAELPNGVLFLAGLAASSRKSLFGVVAGGTALPKGEPIGTDASVDFCPNGETDRSGTTLSFCAATAGVAQDANCCARGAAAADVTVKEPMEASAPPNGAAAAPNGEATDPEDPPANAPNGEATGTCGATPAPKGEASVAPPPAAIPCDVLLAPNGEATVTPLPAPTPCDVLLAPNGEAARAPPPAPTPPPNEFAAAAPLPPKADANGFGAAAQQPPPKGEPAAPPPGGEAPNGDGEVNCCSPNGEWLARLPVLLTPGTWPCCAPAPKGDAAKGLAPAAKGLDARFGACGWPPPAPRRPMRSRRHRFRP